ncbi:MAG: hypothetical protein EOM20_08400 [Spartobacteria bacterium]|nr:hypothetical protein [Spartobacteria bacterium]
MFTRIIFFCRPKGFFLIFFPTACPVNGLEQSIKKSFFYSDEKTIKKWHPLLTRSENGYITGSSYNNLSTANGGVSPIETTIFSGV